MKESYKLTQEQFDYIVEQCDAVLAKYASNASVVGIAWLHVLNSHPANQRKYIHVFYPRSFWDSFWQFSSRLTVLMSDLFLSLFRVSSIERNYKHIFPQTEILIVSHLVNAKAKETEPDFYFRDLPEYLQAHHYQTAVALLNHTKGFAGWNEPLNSAYPQKFILPKRQNFFSEIKRLGKSILTSTLFLRQYFFEKDRLKRSFLLELTRNVFSADTIRAFRIYESIRFLIKKSAIKTVALTWEGHSWERLVCNAIKNADRKILAVAYQHTILFPSSHALKRSISKAYDPDVILTVGAVTKKIIESSPGLTNVKVIEYGSPRLVKKNSFSGNNSLQSGCLVAPEGLINECIILFVFGIETAKRMPDTDFIFRTHPTMRFEDIQSKDTRLEKLPSNVIISSFKEIEDDFKRCSWLLYRSSSVSFFAILAGLRPFYLQLADELTIDPLCQLNSWRVIIQKPEDIVSLIEKDKQVSAEDRSVEIKDAIIFSESYMTPYNMALFEGLIKDEAAVAG